VAENSSRKEIKAAYRRMVGQWHPDRLECRAEDVRQLATRQMASINEAYRLLCSSLPQ
jgi:DnaJ-class molecular chaperone